MNTRRSSRKLLANKDISKEDSNELEKVVPKRRSKTPSKRKIVTSKSPNNKPEETSEDDTDGDFNKSNKITPKKKSKNETSTKKKTITPKSSKDKSEKVVEDDSDNNSSSDSSLNECLKSADKIDLNSSFFDTETKQEESSFQDIEKKLFTSINCLSDSDSSDDDITGDPKSLQNIDELKKSLPDTAIFKQIQNYEQTFKEAKQKYENYKEKSAKKDEVNIKELLAMGETKTEKDTSQLIISDDNEDSSDMEISEEESNIKNYVPKEGVEITVAFPQAQPAKKKTKDDVMASIKRKINRVKKENQVYLHKVHLLCWIAYGNYVNSVLNNEKLLSLALSLIPSQHCYPDGRISLNYLEQITKWYAKIFKLKNEKPKTIEESLKELPLLESLHLQISKREANSKKDFVFIFICILRALGIQCRLILSFRVLPIRPPASELCSLANKSEKKTKEKDNNPTKSKSGDGKSKKKTPEKTKSNQGQSKKKTESGKKPSVSSKIPQVDGLNDDDTVKKKNTKEKSNKTELSKTKKSTPKSRPTVVAKVGMSLRNKNPAKSAKGKSEQTATESTIKTRSKNVAKDVVELVKKRIREQKQQDKMKLAKVKQMQIDDSSSDSSLPEPVLKKKRKESSDEEFDMKMKNRIKSKVKELKKIDRRVLSTDDDDSADIIKESKKGNDVWIEVFVEEEEKWISVDVIKAQVHCVQELSSRASQPIVYVVAWNNDGTIKDVTSRYCKNWNTVTRKLRVDKEWWQKTLKPYEAKKTAREREEDEELLQQQLDQPLPTSISEYKNHPLYALKRHLLKFEAIYPNDAPTLGFIRGEPVYARDCVHTLHSRETWIKEAKVVKPKQEPYKIVKARPKYDKLTGTVTTDIPLELFGIWQVQDYEPPEAKNGKVPRNCYGNVDLFKPCMLPKGTVHLQLPGLNKTARKLEIDCAPAVVGFDFHSGWSHPVLDGYVVCEEYKDTLIAAWEQEQHEAEKRAREKIEKRVYDNWRRLIKGLLIRERLHARYDFGGETSKSIKKDTKIFKKIPKKKKICSDSDTDG